jgi:hypothetical protein
LQNCCTDKGSFLRLALQCPSARSLP